MDIRRIAAFVAIVAAALLAVTQPTLAADTPSAAAIDTLAAEAGVTDALAAERGETAVARRIAAEFKPFAGSERNASALIDGVRLGNAATLAGETPMTKAQVMATTTVTVMPPTRAMGYGDVFTALAVARQQLAAAGIAQPTPDQIKAALTGGAIAGADPTAAPARLDGVLALRAQGLSWNRIAERLGVPLGPIASRLKATNAAIANPVATRHGVVLMGGLPPGIVGYQGGNRTAAVQPGVIEPGPGGDTAPARRLLSAVDPAATGGETGIGASAANAVGGVASGVASSVGGLLRSGSGRGSK